MSELGKRYICEKCGGELLCTRPGGGTMECCDTPMQRKAAKPLPSSD
jgi:hypothetical protein